MKDETIISYLKNELPEKEITEVKNWINYSEENEKYFNRLKFIWENSLSDYRDVDIPSEKAWDRIHSSITSRETGHESGLRTGFASFRRIAAILVILVSVGFLVTYIARQNRDTEMEWISANTTSGIKDIILDDGTHVWLNKNSEITYSGKFKGSIREIGLKGEAYFEVERNRRKPFIIHVAASEIRVLGTRFNVKSGRITSDVIVTVVSGRVSLCDTSDTDNRIILGPGEQGLNFQEIAELVKKENDDMNFLAWKTGILVFENAPLEEVCNALSGYFNRPFIMDNIIMFKDKTLTTTLDNKDLADVMKILEITLDISCKTNNDTITLTAN